MSGNRVLLAVVTGAHGVSGRVRLKTFTEAPEDVGAYGPVTDRSGERQFGLKVTGATKGGVIAELSGVRKREDAEALKGEELYVGREALPDLDDAEDFYHADLIGLAVETVDGQRLGIVRAVHDFGAGDVLDVKPSKGPGRMLPFTLDVVPEIDLPNGVLKVLLPDEIEVIDTGEDDGGEAG
ncbi:MAG: ribosome maturation factor RimM [Minwuia sp.]|uniref:ribosome maturation factor RimM n=1 Tax=Minwuia sp. TaxID=2493630 RepID=UPI003A8B806D